jgi:hypothetical protein
VVSRNRPGIAVGLWVGQNSEGVRGVQDDSARGL